MDALRLRRWTLRVLVGHAPGRQVDVPQEIAGVSAATWGLFLYAERCALALRARLDQAARDALPVSVREVIEDAARRELKKALAARAQLERLSQITRQIGCRLIVLKGGVPAASGARLVDLDDIDVLATPDAAGVLAETLDSRSYRLLGGSTPRHLSGRLASGELPVDIHTTLNLDGTPTPERVWRDAVPIEARPGLWKLGAKDHLWQILEHSVVDHPYRRGQIRDLILAGDAAAACSRLDLEDVEKRVRRHPSGGPLNGQLSMARSIAGATTVPNVFERTALTNYLILKHGRFLRLPGNLGLYASKWTTALLEGPAARRELWGETLAINLGASRFAIVSWVERRSPRLGRVWKLGLRLLRVPLALAIALPLAGLARYTGHRAGLRPGPV